MVPLVAPANTRQSKRLARPIVAVSYEPYFKDTGAIVFRSQSRVQWSVGMVPRPETW